MAELWEPPDEILQLDGGPVSCGVSYTKWHPPVRGYVWECRISALFDTGEIIQGFGQADTPSESKALALQMLIAIISGVNG